MVLRACPLVLALTAAAMLPPCCVAAESMVVYYVQRPPFMGRDADGGMTGLLVPPAVTAFARAGIVVTWVEASPVRQISIIQGNASRVCALGRYKTPERAAFAKFSIAFYQDSASVGLANVNFKVAEHPRAADLMADPNVTVLLKEDILLGPYTQDLIAHMKARRVGTTNDYEQMVRMIQAGRAQFAFFSGEEEAYYHNKLGFTERDFKIIHFADMPPGEKRYIMCSRMVEDGLMEKINAGLK